MKSQSTISKIISALQDSYRFLIRIANLFRNYLNKNIEAFAKHKKWHTHNNIFHILFLLFIKTSLQLYKSNIDKICDIFFLLIPWFSNCFRYFYYTEKAIKFNVNFYNFLYIFIYFPVFEIVLYGKTIPSNHLLALSCV